MLLLVVVVVVLLLLLLVMLLVYECMKQVNPVERSPIVAALVAVVVAMVEK